MKTKFFGWMVAAAMIAVLTIVAGSACEHHKAGGNKGGFLFSSKAYKGHPIDTDANTLVMAYPLIFGTRLDDCQACHRGGTVRKPASPPGTYKNVTVDPCTYCHYVNNPPAGWLDLPTSFANTLNPFGADYDAAGRDLAALRAIDGVDSDGDGFINGDEIRDIRYPGDPNSKPGQTLCSMVTVNRAQIIANPALPKYEQLMLLNTNKQQFDTYAAYKGVRMKDLLREVAGVDLDDPAVAAAVTGIHVLSPDGYKQTFTVDLVRDQFPDHYYYTGLGVDDLDECGFVEYPPVDPGLADGETIPNQQWHLLAYMRDGRFLDSSYLDPVSGSIMGEGPFRNAIPPWNMTPGGAACNYTDPTAANFFMHPDWGMGYPTAGCEPVSNVYPYLDCAAHNAGYMAKGAVIIRIMPMPLGCEEFDIINGGWGLVNDNELLIYGYGVTP